MKVIRNLPVFNNDAFFSFVKLEMDRQIELLNAEGIFLDSFSEKGNKTNLYFFKGFFVEETVTQENNIIDITAFRQGYKIGNYFETREMITIRQAS